MARPKEFDREQALMSAVKTFWTHGYGGTSIQDLVDAMGIHRASLYDTFGSKQTLFEEVLKRYGPDAAERRQVRATQRLRRRAATGPSNPAVSLPTPA